MSFTSRGHQCFPLFRHDVTSVAVGPEASQLPARLKAKSDRAQSLAASSRVFIYLIIRPGGRGARAADDDSFLKATEVSGSEFAASAENRRGRSVFRRADGVRWIWRF